MAYARARAVRVDEDELAPPRRTVTITGHPGARRAPMPRVVDFERRRGGRAGHVVDEPRQRPRRSAAERVGPRPDRLAMWALMMALFLIVLVMVSPHG
ncbi:MAG: hypothetical protein QOK04_143 [Solirubrobacteraceae bacterium]|jgi:hypothetical protein|nr:hypothetical protein [Solirubrobacteraceae bacterium]